MYILLDTERMVITHKHSDKRVLDALGWIECQCTQHVFAMGDSVAISHYTILELSQIYEAATGKKIISSHNHMVRLVADLTMRMPETKVTGDPIAACKKISPADPRFFIWKDGQAVPQNGAVQPDPIKCERNVEAEENTAYIPPVKVAARPQWRPTAADQAALGAVVPAAGATPAVRDPSAPRAPRQSGIRDKIYEVADRIWEAAGKPTDASTVLKLRKQMMEELETIHGVKRNTSSNSLGDWQKMRVVIA
jgi:hypothetical protein